MVLAFLMFIVSNSRAQVYKAIDNGIKATVNSIDVEIRFYSPSIVRIVQSPQGRSFSKESLSVIKQPQKVAVSVKQQGDLLQLTSEKLRVGLNVKSGDYVCVQFRELQNIPKKVNLVDGCF